MADKENAFDLLRIILAASVLIAHSLLIAGYTLQDPLAVLSKGQLNLADFGVMGFFALSGYLITSSFERGGNLFTFASHRLLRILPGFWVCLIVTAFVLSPLIFLFSSRPVAAFDFAGREGSVAFVLHNFFLKINQWSVKDLLNNAAYKDSLNGSLWSLFPEMQCYCFTLVGGIFGLFNKNRMLYLMVAITIFTFFAINYHSSGNYGPTLLTLSPAFKLYTSYFAGSLVYVFRDQLSLDKKGTLFLFLFALLLVKFGGFNLISPLLIAMVLINIFRLFKCKLKYDVSYGVYIYSFPVQQLLFQIVGNRLPVTLFILLALLISVGMGLLSYVLIERRFIRLRKKTDPVLLKLYQQEAKSEI